MKKGLIQVYNGNGKGKTTAAIGQGIRAIGHNYKVIMIQFLKSYHSGELNTLKKLEPDFKLFRFEKERDFFWNLNEEEKEDLKADIENGINFAKKVLINKQCDVLILDEILGAIKTGLLDIKDICEMLDNKPETVEIILTGRVVPDEIVERADYISTINSTKHPYMNGIKARKGIEF